jgi:TatD DNase family protein
MNVLSAILLAPIRAYRKFVSPLLPPRCRYVPTCSQYAIEAIGTYGAFRGSYLALRRILRCNPWGGSGYDPLPLPQRPIDIHTHRAASDGSSICNLSPSDFATHTPTAYCSIGYHPWSLADNPAPDWDLLRRVATHPHVVAIGESGLDKACDVPLAVQEEAFRRHIHIAMEVHKPLIVHCVRAFEELMAVTKEMDIDVPIVIHGYRRGQELVTPLLRAGFYLSFGERYQTDALVAVPLERLFLETDESRIPVATLYERTAALRGMSVPALMQAVRMNVKRVFGV